MGLEGLKILRGYAACLNMQFFPPWRVSTLERQVACSRLVTWRYLNEAEDFGAHCPGAYHLGRVRLKGTAASGRPRDSTTRGSRTTGADAACQRSARPGNSS